MAGRSMYEIHCADCGDIGFHPSRVGAELVAETHIDETDHECHISPMADT